MTSTVSPIYPAGDAIIEGYEVSQVQFSLGEYMLTIPDDLLLFQLLGDSTQNKLFYHLSRDRDESDWPPSCPF